VADWANFLKEIYIDWSKKRVKTPIGGVGGTVEVDETLIEGQWVVQTRSLPGSSPIAGERMTVWATQVKS